MDNRIDEQTSRPSIRRIPRIPERAAHSGRRRCGTIRVPTYSWWNSVSDDLVCWRHFPLQHATAILSLNNLAGRRGHTLHGVAGIDDENGVLGNPGPIVGR